MVWVGANSAKPNSQKLATHFFEEKFDTTPQMWYNNYITAVESTSDS